MKRTIMNLKPGTTIRRGEHRIGTIVSNTYMKGTGSRYTSDGWKNITASTLVTFDNGDIARYPYTVVVDTIEE